jgi:hypothetical protein
MSEPGAGTASGIGNCPSGIGHVDGAKLNQASARNVRTWPAMARERHKEKKQ